MNFETGTSGSFTGTDGDVQWDQSNDPDWSTMSIGWHHVALTYQQSSKKLVLVVDGQQGSTFVRTIKSTYTIKSFMGPGYFSDNLNFRGYWRSVSMYDVTLKVSEVVLLHAAMVDVLNNKGTDGIVANIERCDVNNNNHCSGFYLGEQTSPLDNFRSLSSGKYIQAKESVHSRIMESTCS